MCQTPAHPSQTLVNAGRVGAPGVRYRDTGTPCAAVAEQQAAAGAVQALAARAWAVRAGGSALRSAGGGAADGGERCLRLGPPLAHGPRQFDCGCCPFPSPHHKLARPLKQLLQSPATARPFCAAARAPAVLAQQSETACASV